MDGEEGGEREEGDVEVETDGESGEGERLLVGLLLGEPRGDEYGDRACSIRPLRSWMACCEKERIILHYFTKNLSVLLLFKLNHVN